MSHTPANATNDRLRPRAPSLNLHDVRNVRPQMRTASMPPGTTTAYAQPTRPPGVVGSSTSSVAPPPPPPPPYERRTEEALLRAPSRINQPHLHPDKINGAFVIGVDLEVHEFIKATWQGNYWGPWQSCVKVPKERRTSCNNTTGKIDFMRKSTSNGSFRLK
ncbi:hypothetical protein F2Q70_00002220 [Brassica cretica]|uniref:Uncharacterized protein n=1 Tax=Brassica cretica TaxID=69181 RepID=A0A8S9J1G7_BRACR|nr:hypothetical protein F2Q70_00002220 [Brassica cretica]